MSAKRRRLSKKEYERLERELADQESKARAGSQARQERIKELWNLITSGKLSPRDDESEDTARDLKSEIEDKVFAEWTTVKKGESEKGLRRRDREDTRQRRSSNELVRSLVEPTNLQKAEIEQMRPSYQLCEWAKTHAPNELAPLREKHLEKDPFARVLRAVVARATHLTSKQASEWRRTQSRREEVGLIEYEFGDEAEARLGFPYNPTCLDAILMGYGVMMGHLEFLFGMERHRFPKELPSVRDGRRILYSALAVVKIMDALLKEKLAKRKPRARGGSEKKLWLSTPDVRKRVLTGIGWRALAVSRYREILAPFMTVVSRHLTSGDSEERLPNDAEDALRAHIRSIPFLGSLSATCPDSGK